MSPKISFIDRDFYITSGYKPSANRGGDAGDHGADVPAVGLKSYESDVAQTDPSEIFNSTIDSDIELVIKSLTRISESLKSFKKRAIGLIAGSIDAIISSGAETSLSNMAEVAHINTAAGSEIMNVLQEELPRIKDVIGNPTFMSFFHMSPEGKLFLETFRAQIEALDKNFRSPKGDKGSSRSDGLDRLEELMRILPKEISTAQRKERMDAFVVKYGNDLGEGRIKEFLGDIYAEQMQFIKSIESVVDTFGNLEEDSHANYSAYKDTRGRIKLKSGAESPDIFVTKDFIDKKIEDVKRYPDSVASTILGKLRPLRPLRNAADAMQFALITNMSSIIAAGESAVDPVSNKKFLSEPIGEINSNLARYFRDNKGLVDTFSKIIVDFEIFNAEIREIKKSYTIKSPSGKSEGKIKLNYKPEENLSDDLDDANTENIISGVYIDDNGSEIDLGTRLLSDFLTSKSIKESLFISKINGGNTDYALEIYIFLIQQYIRRGGVSNLYKFKNSVIYDRLERIFIPSNESSDEYEDPQSAMSGEGGSSTEGAATKRQAPARDTGWLQGKALPKKLYDAHKEGAPLEDGFDISSTINVFRSGGNSKPDLNVDPEGQRQWRGGMGDEDSYAYHAYHEPSNTMLMTDFRGKEKEELFKLLDDLIQSKGVKNITEKDLEAIREKVEGKRASGRMESLTMKTARRSGRLDLFLNHPRVAMLRRAIDSQPIEPKLPAESWSDILGDPNSELSREVGVLKTDISALGKMKEMIELSGDDSSLPAVNELEKKIEESKRKITTAFPGIRLKQVLSATFYPGEQARPQEAKKRDPNKKITIQRQNDVYLKQVENIKELFPKYKANRHNLEVELYMLDDQTSPAAQTIKSKMDDLDSKIGVMVKQIEYLVRKGIVDREEISNEIYGKIKALPRSLLPENELKTIREKVTKFTNEFNQLSLQLDSVSENVEIDTIKNQMDVVAGQIAELHRILKSNLKKGGDLPYEEIERDSYEKVRKNIKEIMRTENYSNEQIAATHYFLMVDPVKVENVKRTVKNLNENDQLREYIRTNFPEFLGTKASPGIVQRAIAAAVKAGAKVDDVEE